MQRAPIAAFRCPVPPGESALPPSSVPTATRESDKVDGNRTIFDIRGGYYRLVTWIDYDRGLVVMKWFGTHAEYDRGEWK